MPVAKASKDPASILSGASEPVASRPAAKPVPEKAEKPEAKVAADKPPKEASKGGTHLIQLAALSDPAKAEALKTKLAGMGIHASISRAETSKGQISRVRVGPFASQEEAKTVLNKMSAAGVTGILVSK